MVQLCNPLTLKSQQFGGVRSISGRAPPFECHDKGVVDSIGSALFLRSKPLALQTATSPSPAPIMTNGPGKEVAKEHKEQLALGDGIFTASCSRPWPLARCNLPQVPI